MRSSATPTAPAASAAASSWITRRRVALFLSWAALTAAITVALTKLPWLDAVAQLDRVGLGWVSAAIIANFAILPVWALEWQLLIPGRSRITYGRMLEVIAVMTSVLNSVPFFAGEASGVAMLIGRAGLTRGAAVSVLAMDQLLVGVAKLTIIAAAAAYSPLPQWLSRGVFALVLAVLALLTLLIPMAHGWEDAQRRLLSRSGKWRSLAARFVGIGTHLEVLRDARRVVTVVALALIKKFAEVAGILAVQAAFGMDPSLSGALLITAALALTTMLPVSPANLAVFEATVFAVYRWLGIPAETALGLAVVQHVCFLMPTMLGGYLMLALRQLLPERAPAS